MKGTSKIMIITLLVMSVVFCVECKNWWTLWLLLEMNSFMFLINLVKEIKKEKMFVFFIFQAISSSFLMLFVFFNSWMIESNFFKNIEKIVLVSIFLKIGMFPFHNWMMSMSKNLSWSNLMLLFSWQKIIPIVVLMKSKMMSNFFLILCLSMMVMGVLMAKLNETKIIMTTSSLMHNSLMFLPISIYKMVSIFYLLSYTTMVIPSMKIFSKNMMKKLSNQIKSKNSVKEMIILMINLSSTPPTVGFLAKMVILLFLLKISSNMASIMMIFLSACLSFYAYFSLFSKSFSLNSKKSLSKTLKEKQKLITTKIYFAIPLVVWT